MRLKTAMRRRILELCAEQNLHIAALERETGITHTTLCNILGGRNNSTTLLTLLSRLADKGFVRAEKQGRSSVYYPLVTKKEYLGAQGRRFLFRAVCKNSVIRDG